MTLPSICSGVFHTWIWVKKNSMLKKPTCAGLQVPLYQQKYGVWCQATMSVHFCKCVLIENEHHSSEAKSTTIVSRQIPRQNKAEMYVNVKSTRGGQIIAFLLLLRMMMSSVPPPLIPWGSSNSGLSLHSAFNRIAYAPNTPGLTLFRKTNMCTDVHTHTTCTSTRVSNQREEIHFLYILRFPGFLMAQKGEFWTANNASVATFHKKDETQNSHVLKIRQEKLWKLENCHTETMFLRMRNGNDKRIPPTCLPQCNHITATEARIAQRQKARVLACKSSVHKIEAWSRKKQQTLFLEVNEDLHRDY